MTNKELLSLLSSGHGRAAKYILERDVDDYADVILKAMLRDNPNGDQTYGRYWARFVKAMDRPEAIIDPVYDALGRRMHLWRRMRLLYTATWFLDLGYEQFRPIVESPRSKLILDYKFPQRKVLRDASTADEILVAARAGLRVAGSAARSLPSGERLRLVCALFDEQDENARGILVWCIRAMRTVPIGYQPLLEWTSSRAVILSYGAAALLANISHPLIREKAMALAKGTDFEIDRAARMIESSWRPGDAPMLREWLHLAKRLDVRHSVGIMLKTIARESNEHEWDWVLPTLYSELECEECRLHIVYLLIKHRRFSVEWAEEGLFDASTEIVKDCKKYLRNRKRSTTELRRLADV